MWRQNDDVRVNDEDCQHDCKHDTSMLILHEQRNVSKYLTTGSLAQIDEPIWRETISALNTDYSVPNLALVILERISSCFSESTIYIG